MSGLSRRAFLFGLSELTPREAEVSLPPPRRAAAVPRDDAAVARLLPTACLAFRGTPCTSCVERCPVPGALRLVGERPTIDRDRCDGCGECIDVCPAPVPAIVRDPRPAQRPSA